MIFLTSFVPSIAAFARVSFAAPTLHIRDDSNATTFGLVAIHSDSPVHEAPIKVVDSHLHVFSVGGDEGNPVVLSFQENSSLKDSGDRSINVDGATGEIGVVGENEAAATGFSIDDRHLAYQGSQSFFACPSGENKYSLTFNSECPGGIDIELEISTSN